MLSDLELLIACLVLASGLPIALVLRRKTSARAVNLLAIGVLCCGVAVPYGVNGEPLFSTGEFAGEVEIIGDNRGFLLIVEDGVVAEFDLQQGDGVSLPHDFTPFSADRYPTRDLLPPADDTYLTPDIDYREVTHRRLGIITDSNFCRLREPHSPSDIQRRGLTTVSPVHAEMSNPIIGRHLVPVVEFLDSRRYPGPALPHGISGDSQGFSGGASSAAGVVQGPTEQHQASKSEPERKVGVSSDSFLSSYIKQRRAKERIGIILTILSASASAYAACYGIFKAKRFGLEIAFASLSIGAIVAWMFIEPMMRGY